MIETECAKTESAQLEEELTHAARVRSCAVPDGEIVCLRPDGVSDFYSLLYRRAWPVFYAGRHEAFATRGNGKSRTKAPPYRLAPVAARAW